MTGFNSQLAESLESIAQHKSWRLVPGKRFPHLLHGPLLRGVFRHPEVQHPASLLR
jgi:hypothetical protein